VLLRRAQCGGAVRPDPRFPARGSVLPEGAFDFSAGLLQAGFNVVTLALSLQSVVAGGIACRFFGLAVKFPGSVMDLLTQTHF
jgi:hypothetical protein